MPILAAVSVTCWAVVILVPLAVLFAEAISPVAGQSPDIGILNVTVRSFLLAGVVACAAVVLGYTPGRLLGSQRIRQDMVLLLTLMPLVLPRYVLYYAWSLLLSPTTSLGAYLGHNPEVARFIGGFSASMVLVLWFWPLAALVLSHRWRSIDRRVLDSASVDAGPWGVFRYVTLPLLGGSILLAFGVCFVMALSDFSTFHLAGIETIGTQLAVLYELTGSQGAVARAALPVMIVAASLAVVLGARVRVWYTSGPFPGGGSRSGPWRWSVLFALVTVSVIIPIAVLIGNMTGVGPFLQFFRLHADELAWSLVTGIAAALMTYLIASTVFFAYALPRWGRLVAMVVSITVFLAMLVPASLIGTSMLKVLAVCRFPVAFRQGWYLVSAGQAARFSGVTLIILLLIRTSQQHRLAEAASLDGASAWATWRHIYLPGSWAVFAGSFLLILMFSVTELPATMVLLPAGLPNFAQRLLNQMHYARDQQVIASCLVLIGLFLILTAVLVMLLRRSRVPRYALMMLVCAGLFSAAGCEVKSASDGGPEVLYSFGVTGGGQVQFIYPRAIDMAGDGTFFVVDKTGRVQHLTEDGRFLDDFRMPAVEVGKPTGISISAGGNLYVADTHYHRVAVLSPDGRLVSEFGRFGEEEGCFIYPTDVAFSGDGRIFVSEYGGNDRISVFSEAGEFLYCFGSCGDGPGQLSRPSAVCADQERKRLYVADACNHRIAVYDFDGTLLKYIGSAGTEAGMLRYPYDLDLAPDGTLVVCEYGNNRVQLFSPEGVSVGIYGSAGRQLGQLAYPWGLVIDARGRSFIVDAGNDRIQVWQL
ncbi:MAG: 6-bladed beta-propeller [Planctomycetes bacterium]|nr:6-bladed beta-propeller [Planctomycetota bacterium]